MERGQGNSKKETDVEGKKKKIQIDSVRHRASRFIRNTNTCKQNQTKICVTLSAGRIQHKNEDCSLRATNNKENCFIVGKPRKLILLI